MADTELSNLRHGTDVVYGVGDGSDKGTAYAQEFLCSDKTLCDRAITYIKGDTDIAMSHNQFNNMALYYTGNTAQYYRVIGANGLDGIADSGDEGIIRFRVDRYWQDRSTHSGHRESTGLVGNSITTHDFGTGSKSWTVTDTTKPSWAVGMRLRVSRKSSTLSNATVYVGAWMEGAITAWNSSTGVVTIDVDRSYGALTGVSLWRITLAAFPAYSAPFTFDDLTYEAGVPVVGTTGPSVDPVTNRNAHYYRGLLDEFGDEWHTLCVGHDDEVAGVAALPSMKAEFFASDGRDLWYVLNPKTPCLTIRTTGNAEFYTSPPKAYHLPKVVARMETRFTVNTGTVTFELRDINGDGVNYRIVTSLSSSDDFVAAGANNITLDDTDFPAGTSYLQYYCDGRLANMKTRVVVKNPTHPSLTESHGHRLWGNSTELDRIRARLNRAPYAAPFAAFKASDSYLSHNYWDLNGLGGHRWPWFLTSPSWSSAQASFGGSALVNAFIALIDGWSATRSGKALSFGQYAKQMVLHNPWARVDPVGFESNHGSGAHASTETIGAGYYSVRSLLDSVYAYDILAGNFRSDQVAGGLTPCEDYYIRDVFGAAAIQGAMNLGAMTQTTGEMWGSARSIASAIIGMMMPEYASAVFGTSGYGATTTTYPITPFRDVEYTWKELFSDRGLTVTAFPNIARNFNPESTDLWTAAGNWGGSNLGYFNLMKDIYQDMFNMWALHSVNPTTSFPRASQGMLNAINGVLYGTPPGANPAYSALPFLANAKFPVHGPASKAAIQSRNAEATEITNGRVRALIWYDDELESGGGSGGDTAPAITTQPTSQTVTEGQSVTFTAAASGSPFPTYQWKKGGSNIAGQTNATLTFIVSPSDAGSYTCTATNSAGSATTNAAVLTVIPLPTPPPLVITGRANVRAGISAIIGC